MTNPDVEMKAMQLVWRNLKVLDDAGKARILKYMLARVEGREADVEAPDAKKS